MALARFGRQAKRQDGFCVKMIAVTVLGLCFIFVWSMFSSPSSSVTSQRGSFGEIAEPVSSRSDSSKVLGGKKETQIEKVSGDVKKVDLGSDGKKMINGSESIRSEKEKRSEKEVKVEDGLSLKGIVNEEEEKGNEKEGKSEGEEEVVVDDKEEKEENGGEDLSVDNVEDEISEPVITTRKKGKMGPLLDSKRVYNWRMCNTRSKHNYIPCIDNEVNGKLRIYRHRERFCPQRPPMCLVPLPHEGYESPVRWPESKQKIFYKNVAHPKLAAFIRTQNWVVETGEYLSFPQNESDINGGVLHYLEFIEEMVPDIEWGKNIRIVLDVGCKDSSFGASLLDKEVLTLSLGLKDDLVDLAQVALERGFPAVVSPFGTRRLPFPSGVFDAIHCSGCSVSWHSNGGKLLLEMNRILRPGGYFILSTKHDSIEDEEGMTTMAASICWNILAHKTDDVSEVGIKIYQKPDSNDIYELRRKKVPPLCKDDEKPDAAWYVPMKTCLHTIPSAIEQRGSEWPEEWPKRLETFPEWVNNKEKLVEDTEHWKAVVNKSYMSGMGIDWSTIHNVMDMKAIYGGFATALSQEKVWVMNVVPVHAPDTLPIIYERGLAGIYHDWCESFGTYPRSYDLLHADHLFSRLKNSCKHPIGIVVEMDRILRPGGWAIIREKVEILNPLEGILKSLHWEIRMTFSQDKEGIICAQKTLWRP